MFKVSNSSWISVAEAVAEIFWEIEARKAGTSGPVSRILYSACAERRSFLWARHRCRALATYPKVLTRRAGACPPKRTPSLFGLAPCGVYRALDIAAQAVRSYRTFSPLPFRRAGRRYVFCGTGRLPALTLESRTLSGTLLCGVRTFLPGEPGRPSGPLASTSL